MVRPTGERRSRSRPAAVAAISVALFAMSDCATATAAEQRMAPFSLKRLNGETFDSTTELGGRLTILSFWRLDQVYSVRLLEDLARIHDEFTGRGVRPVALICDQPDLARVRELVGELELGFPIVLDPDRKVYRAFDAIVFPSSWFIDAEGFRRFAYPGRRRDFPVVARANLEFLLGEISEAERQARIERDAAPPTKGTVGGPVRYRLSKKLLESGEPEAARKQLLEAFEREPRVAAAGVDLGLLLLEEGANQAALKILEEAAALDRDDQRASGAMGAALIRLGRADEGAPLLRSALEGGVQEPLLYYEMARWSETRDLDADALRYYKHGLELLLEIRGRRD